NHAEGDLARELVAELRRLLAQASIQALEPDLVVLDEFQRFRYLLTTDTPAGELAGQLFMQPDARVLLLSATPYKPFTYAEEAAEIEPTDLTAYVALHRLAVLLDAPLSVEYWKSAPYFGNFLAGYKAGEKLKEALKGPGQHPELLSILRAMQRLQRVDVRGFERLDWGNARLRRLASETVDAGWWQLLWVPPSLPYHELGGPYASKSI